MVLPPGHGQQLAAPRSLSRREKRLISGVIAAVAVLALILALSIGNGGQASGRGCIYATVAGPVGAEQIDQCGAQARDTCRTVAAPGSFTPEAARVVAAQCRKAGLPVGS